MTTTGVRRAGIFVVCRRRVPQRRGNLVCGAAGERCCGDAVRHRAEPATRPGGEAPHAHSRRRHTRKRLPNLPGRTRRVHRVGPSRRRGGGGSARSGRPGGGSTRTERRGGSSGAPPLGPEPSRRGHARLLGRPGRCLRRSPEEGPEAVRLAARPTGHGSRARALETGERPTSTTSAARICAPASRRASARTTCSGIARPPRAGTTCT